MLKVTKRLVRVIVTGILLLMINVSVFAQDTPPGYDPGNGSSTSSIVEAINILTKAVNDNFQNFTGFISDNLITGLAVSNASAPADDKLLTTLKGNAADSIVLDLTNTCVADTNRLQLGIESPNLRSSPQFQDLLSQTNCEDSSLTFDNFYNKIFPITLESVPVASGITEAGKYLNPEVFLGDLQYNSSSAQDARSYIRYLESQGRGSLVDLGDYFKKYSSDKYVLYYNPNPGSTAKYIMMDMRSDMYNNVLTSVKLDQQYRDYIADYRAAIVKRALAMNNIINSYLKRVPAPSGGASQHTFPAAGVSVAQYQHNEVYKRLSSDYYQKMQTASPPTIAKETLFTLNQILFQLYELNQRSERMLIAGTVNTMPDLTTSKDTKNNLLQLIYCKAAANGVKDTSGQPLDKSVCVQSSDGIQMSGG